MEISLGGPRIESRQAHGCTQLLPPNISDFVCCQALREDGPEASDLVPRVTRSAAPVHIGIESQPLITRLFAGPRVASSVAHGESSEHRGIFSGPAEGI